MSLLIRAVNATELNVEWSVFIWGVYCCDGKGGVI